VNSGDCLLSALITFTPEHWLSGLFTRSLIPSPPHCRYGQNTMTHEALEQLVNQTVGRTLEVDDDPPQQQIGMEATVAVMLGVHIIRISARTAARLSTHSKRLFANPGTLQVWR
jgi:hypothetical protein